MKWFIYKLYLINMQKVKQKDVIYTAGLKHPENLIREAIHEAIIGEELSWSVICVVVSSPKQVINYSLFILIRQRID